MSEFNIKKSFETVEELETYLNDVQKLTHWDYTNAGEFKEVIEKVGKETFEKDFINNIHGKRSVSANGLRYLSHYKKVKSIKTECLELKFDKSGNPNFCLFKATVIGYDYSPEVNGIVEVEHTSHSDATPGNVTPTMKDSFIRIGETRAINRALINYLNIDMNSSEELYNNDNLEPQIVSEELLDGIMTGAKKLDMSEEEVVTLINKYNKKEKEEIIENIDEALHEIAAKAYNRLKKKYDYVKYLGKLSKEHNIDPKLVSEKVKTDYSKDSVKQLSLRQLKEVIDYFKEKVKEEKSA